jgi:hypothetical protein
MTLSAVDVARESIECYNPGVFDCLRSLLADDFLRVRNSLRSVVSGEQMPGSRRQGAGSVRFQTSTAR